MNKSTDGKVDSAEKHINTLEKTAEVDAFVKGDTRKGVKDAARKRNKQIEDAIADAAAAAKAEADEKAAKAEKPKEDPPAGKPKDAPKAPSPAKKAKAEKKQVPNQHLADRIAGKINERGEPIK